MAETQLEPTSTTLVAGKVIADTTFSEDEKDNLIFPISYRQDYLGKVVFSVVEEEETNIEEIKQAMKTKQESLSENSNAFDERGERLKKNAQENAEELKRRAEAKSQSYRKNTVNKSVLQNEPSPSQKSATLFLPQGITFADGVQYENVDLGTLGGLAEQAAGGAIAGDGFLGSVGGGVTSLIDSFKGPTGEGAGRLAANAASKVFGSGVSAGVRAQTKVTLNPNTRSLFKSVNLRSFSFTFKMIPLSINESETIKKIVKFFRTELYPEHILLGEEQDQAGQVPLGYKFPNKFLIQMYYNEKQVATKILPCYLQSMQTVYNGTSMGMHEDGSFQEVDITLNFTESRTLNRKDVLNNGY
jgi:hypothetical protein